MESPWSNLDEMTSSPHHLSLFFLPLLSAHLLRPSRSEKGGHPRRVHCPKEAPSLSSQQNSTFTRPELAPTARRPQSGLRRGKLYCFSSRLAGLSPLVPGQPMDTPRTKYPNKAGDSRAFAALLLVHTSQATVHRQQFTGNRQQKPWNRCIGCIAPI